MLRPWKLAFSIQRDSTLPVHLQITQCIADEIQRGRLPPGTALPGTRTLAVHLTVNRKTVVMAYDELAAQGWVHTQGRRGTFVLPALQLNTPHTPPTQTHPPSQYLPPSARSSDIITFTDGIPDSRLIPFEVLGRAYRRALIAAARANQLAYGDPRGEHALRTALADMLRTERGLSAEADNLCIMRGSQMGIYVAARVLTRPGGHVALDALSYPPAREAFEASGAITLPISQDKYGLRPDELAHFCRAHPVQALYLTPHHQFPTTIMMPAERRLHLLALSRQYGFIIIEDDYDHEFHFEHHPAFPMASLEQAAERVLYIGSLSKVLAPGLRIGYMLGAPALIHRCTEEVRLIDRQGNPVTELAVAELMNSGELKRHIRRALRVYEVRRRFFAEQIRSTLSAYVRFTIPAGGLAFWLDLDPKLNVARLEEDALKEGVLLASSRRFSGSGSPPQGIRLGFGNLTPDELSRGIQRLKRAFIRQYPPD